MRKLLFTLSCALLCTPVLRAQDCGNFLYMTKNAEIQMTVYDKKGKESAVQTWKVTDVQKEGSSLSSSIQTSMKDDKGREIASSKGTYKCVNGSLQADVRMSMPQQPNQVLMPTDAQVSSAYLEYPASLSVGQSLKDVNMEMDMNLNGGMPASVSFSETNRKVEAREKVTTPAGTWDAYVISYDGFMKIKMGIGIPMTFQAKEWFVPGVGIVKTESYSKGGKAMGSTMITSIKK